jgi:hypothetical protein
VFVLVGTFSLESVHLRAQEVSFFGQPSDLGVVVLHVPHILREANLSLTQRLLMVMHESSLLHGQLNILPPLE